MSEAIRFSKYHSNGNDFILVDNRGGEIRWSRSEVARICHRRYGVGGDGLILLNSSSDADFEMKNFNSDGGDCTMCGNGGRALVQFAHDLGLIDDRCRFWAMDGEHEAILRGGLVELKMQSVQELSETPVGPALDTGSPHLVIETENLLDHDVVGQGRALRSAPRFLPGGINVNFFEVREEKIFLRTYERGVEDETLSCGTGAIATAMVLHHRGGHGFPSRADLTVHCVGGKLGVRFQQTGPGRFEDVWLIGRSEKTFEGSISTGRSQP